ncbi:MAG: hypothetical protein DMG89_07925 [Acidobacteria bacterium]|nr:MAG: hypothetical protein DMG89_07925 [Acidobacteriota bacterium]
MSGVVERVRGQATINPRLLPAIDQLLVAGIKLGLSKKHDAINKILQLVPEWKRGDCWRRIRQLRRTPALATPPVDQDLKKTENNGYIHRSFSRPWLQEDDERLLDLAGYEPVTKIAERLGRSVRAVRFRLGALGMSARVKDGWSQRGLRKLLRVSRARLWYLAASGMLRVRDPRITGSSLARWSEKNGPPGNVSDNHRPRTAISPQNPYSWTRAAKLLGITVEDIQGLIAAGQLKLLDTFVTDRSFEDFCRKHGNEINLSLMDPATRKWLMSEYGISETADRKAIPRAQKARPYCAGMQVRKEDSRQRLFQACQALPPSANKRGTDRVV